MPGFQSFDPSVWDHIASSLKYGPLNLQLHDSLSYGVIVFVQPLVIPSQLEYYPNIWHQGL